MHDSFNQFFTGKEEQPTEVRLEDLELEDRLLAHDRFKVIRKIGKGGFGTVWLCDDLTRRKKVAVKIVTALQNQGQALLEHAIEELNRRTEIRHTAHILGAYDLHLHREGKQELLLLPMEYADRGSLRDWMKLHQPRCGAWPDLDERFSMFRNCCAGVDALHSAGLVHLDVKPENFLLVSEGGGQFRIKLGDFGLSRNVAQWATGTTGLMLPTRGTPTYMAPEQAKALNRRDLRAPVDIYALGVLLFELGAGYTPYEGATTPEQVMEMHQKEELQEHHFSDVPETWIPAIRSALSKKPSERPSSVRELVEMVKEGKARRSTVPPPPTKPEPTKAERVLMKKQEDQCGDSPDAWDAVADEWEKVVGNADEAARCRNTARVLRERQAEWEREQARKREEARKAAEEEARLRRLREEREAAERATAEAKRAAEKLAAERAALEKAQREKAEREKREREEKERRAARERLEAWQREQARQWAEEEERRRLKEGQRAGEQVRVELPGGVSLELCWCPAGSFQMGSKGREVPVRLSCGFWMGKYPVTQAQWEAVMGSNPSHFKGQNLPVENVSWEDAQAFIGRVNGSGKLPAGWKLALPTEAQWEYACRAGTRTEYWWGSSNNGEKCNCNGSFPDGTERKGPYLQRTTPVGRYGESPWGLCDTHGNVWEWCADWYGDELEGGLDPEGPIFGSYRVLRGGSWLFNAEYCRAASRRGTLPGYRFFYQGFRVAAVPAGAG